MRLVETDLICSNQSHQFNPCSVQRGLSASSSLIAGQPLPSMP
jgi:hypothetical protein